MPPLSQIGPGRASRFASRERRDYHRRTPLPDAALTDTLLATAWIALALDSLWQASRSRAARAPFGPVATRRWRPSLAGGVAVVIGTLAAGALLERLAGRLTYRPVPALVGLALVAGGVWLNHRARRALGALWSPAIQVRTAHTVVETGPYAYVRHPVYAAAVLVAAGSFLAHPSLATACLAGGFSAGVVVKARLEERVLRETLGEVYARYAARVPALVPRLGSSPRST
jgi:protein-S-isoprenylcysteine O-methyltransferase Ste14